MTEGLYLFLKAKTVSLHLPWWRSVRSFRNGDPESDSVVQILLASAVAWLNEPNPTGVLWIMPKTPEILVRIQVRFGFFRTCLRPHFRPEYSWSPLEVVLLFRLELACVASVSVGFGSKERDFWCFARAEKEKKKETKMKYGGGGGEGRKRLQTNPWILKTSVRHRKKLVIGWASRKLLTSVDQRS